MTIPAGATEVVAEVRREVAALHAELPRNGLVVWTAGNVSARVPGHDLLVIKPSGVSYDELTPENMVVCDLEGQLVEGEHAPSSDTAAHAYVYKHMPEVNGVVHTHSTYATAWAARGEPIPCVLTMMGDEFGGEIPIGPFALIGDDSIGQGIVETLRGHRSRAVLMQNHGPFTIGPSAKAAVKAAVLCEEVAQTVHISRQLGEPLPIAQSDIDSLFDRYQNAYGQHTKDPRMSPAPKIWFLTGSQGLYGPETVAQVEQQSQQIVEQLNEGNDLGLPIVWQPVLTDAESIRATVLAANADPDVVGLIAWMHTFSPAKMWIAGMDILKTPFLHLHTQANVSLPWSEIDMDFMNLNQAAHGDREFGYIQTRLGVPRTTVVGHVSDPAVRSRVGAWVRSAIGVAAVRSLKLARFGDNMRDVAVTEGDKVEAQIRFGVSVQAYGVNDLVASVDAASDAEVDDLIETYGDLYDIAPELAVGGERHESLRYGARIEAGLRAFLTDGGFGAFTTNFEDLGGLRQLPGLAVQRLMAEGYGFGGEGDWKTSVMLHTIKAMAAGQPGGTSFMEDYTYHLGPGTPKILGAHMLEVCPTIAADRPRVEVHPLGIGDREDPVRLVFDATPGPAAVVGICDLGDRFRLVLNEVDVVTPDEPLPKLPVARAVWEPRPDLATSAESWLQAGGPHHTVLSTAVGTEELTSFAATIGVELLVIGEGTNRRDFLNEIRWNQAAYRMGMGF